MITIKGRVVHGDKFGRKLGFPTANLDRRSYSRSKLKVRLWVYAGRAVVNGKTYRAAIVIGPLDKNGLPKLEAHLLGFRGSLYGKLVELSLHAYIRAYKKFSGIEALREQISSDVEKIKKMLS